MLKIPPRSTPQIPFDAQSMPYVQQMLEAYLRDPDGVSPAWRHWFHDQRPARGTGELHQPALSDPTIQKRNARHRQPAAESQRDLRSEAQRLQSRADQMAAAYRSRGYLCARLDPLGLTTAPGAQFLPTEFGIADSEEDDTVWVDFADRHQVLTVRELHESLNRIYCGPLGYQFMHIEDATVRSWLLRRIEEERTLQRRDALRQRILRRLTEAVAFEEFVRKKYVGAKTFSLEGAEALIPLLDLAVERAAAQGITEIVIGMPHRGRLNVLANIIGQPMRQIFAQFEDNQPERSRGGGDVKYHLGASGDRHTSSGESVHLSLCFNPSHLEYVNPVAVGRVRAKQDRTRDSRRRRGMGLLIHGDAGFAGEGIVQETFNLSQLPAYTSGGTLHVVVNNQLGFTTGPEQARSMRSAADIARMLQAPIFHVNGECLEAIARVVELAMEFRHEFQCDVVIDMVCFRRHGHNEADEPSFTQPRMYRAIEHHPSIHHTYLTQTRLLDERAEEKFAQIERNYRQRLKDEHQAAQELREPLSHAPDGVWEGYHGGPEPLDEGADEDGGVPDTSVDKKTLQMLLRGMTELPDDFHLHHKLRRSVEQRLEMAAGKRAIDWSAAEALAFATLAIEGHPVRLTGQDCERGTFSQRHAVMHDVVDGHRHEIFARLSDDQARVQIFNSPLCEAAVLGFEYGFSLDFPAALVAWEAQYGDFCNAAQVMIDQFIASAEDKWKRLTGLVLLLPHGFEGQGPEHSSARLERFLTLAAEDNLQVVSPTTPAQYFHVLRRQVKRRWRKPLVILTPKSLLRNARVVSTLDELAQGRFERLLSDERNDAAGTNFLLLCTGKLYYELAKYRQQYKRVDTALVRVEQLYPLSEERIERALRPYGDGAVLRWVQEEPENFGAWAYWQRRFNGEVLGRYPLRVVARAPSASPATGSLAAHRLEQRELIERAFAKTN